MKITFKSHAKSISNNGMSNANSSVKITKTSGIANTEEWNKYRNSGSSLMEILSNALKSR